MTDDHDSKGFTSMSLMSLVIITAIPWLVFFGLRYSSHFSARGGGLIIGLIAGLFALILMPLAIKLSLEPRSIPMRIALIILSCSFLLCSLAVLVVAFLHVAAGP